MRAGLQSSEFIVIIAYDAGASSLCWMDCSKAKLGSIVLLLGALKWYSYRTISLVVFLCALGFDPRMDRFEPNTCNGCKTLVVFYAPFQCLELWQSLDVTLGRHWLFYVL